MRHSISHTLLITLLAVIISCRAPLVQTGTETRNIPVAEATNPLDSNIIRLYLPYKNLLDKDMNRVISYSESEMEKDKPESLLTNFLGDLLLEEAGKTELAQTENIVPSVSFFNYGGIRTSLPKGDITVGKVYELMPFENELVYLKLDGNTMKEFLDYIARKGGDSVGGVRLKISDGKAVDIKIGGQDFDAGKAYWLVTNDYVAGGGDGLEVLKQRLDYKTTGLLIRELIIQNLEAKQKNHETIHVTLDGRISNE
ncbi:5'-nucleotidase C-terminal domain-containing protein [Maribellus sp. YY47]|uniref:5'-nucleotidase C-terminal domain-containing protein n=1 Tax=Maribellus sp. YY47 TaxID=2929486 RepID=UPI0020012870|nr:5'-nucleotidase C-terminal domain-containing protein [Maribellus sp. YY47]MCK3682885.1 5'-nucleotidase C-terminal domain-containing protein [Maribellus sp. YY47]